MPSTEFIAFQEKLSRRITEQRKTGWKPVHEREAERKAFIAERGYDPDQSDYERYHWSTIDETQNVVSYGTLEELDDLYYDGFEYQDPDWTDGPSW